MVFKEKSSNDPPPANCLCLTASAGYTFALDFLTCEFDRVARPEGSVRVDGFQ